jgi:zinc protease
MFCYPAAVRRFLEPAMHIHFPLSLAAMALMSAPLFGQDLEVPFQKFVLDNGLQVVIHEDHSDPVVAVYVNYHVGSGREEVGRSGFAHLFEHLMFQGSKHVGDDQHFKIVSEAGGTLNGTTNRDRTNYYETLPSNQLETALWLEADRMGFLLDSVNLEKLDNQREVVKNERRQNYENVPYAQAEGALMRTLYPANHPYSWLTIGSHEDLTAASLDDVKGFFRRWYGPNNATLCIGGDVDPAHALELARKWFGPLPRGPEVGKPPVRVPMLDHDVTLIEEDKVQHPQLSLIWPAPPRDTAEDGALTMLMAILSASKASILDRALTIDEMLATRVSASWSRGEQSSEIDITVRAAPGVSLDSLNDKIRALLVKLDKDGIDPEALKRQQNRYEADFVNRLETVAPRTSALCDANMFTGDPANVTRLLKLVLATTPEQVHAALRRYMLGKPAIVLSVVPEGKRELACTGRSAQQMAAEAAIDRSVRPAPLPTPAFKAPVVWHDSWDNGVSVTGTRYTELPIVTLQLSVPGGHRRESVAQAGLSSLTAQLMNEGTAVLDTLSFTDELDALGISLNVGSDDDEISISLRTLRKHLPEATALFRDVVLRPRLSDADFERLKTQRLAALESRGDSIRTVAGNVWDRILYGRDSLLGWPGGGTPESVAALTVDDVRAFHRNHVVPAGARLLVVGDLDAGATRDLLAELATDWKGAALPPLPKDAPLAAQGVKIYLVDRPGAPQSELRAGHPSVSSMDPDWYPLTVMNYSLGGAFSSRINMNLREAKGYTYGARSSFSGGSTPGPFEVSTAVRTDVTRESVVEIINELKAIRDGLKEEEVAFARDALVQAANRQYESVNALGGLLDNVSRYKWPDDYPGQRLKFLGTVGKQQLDGLAKKYVQPDTLHVLVVGDASKVREGLAGLGYPVVELDIDGNPLPEG